MKFKIEDIPSDCWCLLKKDKKNSYTRTQSYVIDHNIPVHVKNLRYSCECRFVQYINDIDCSHIKYKGLFNRMEYTSNDIVYALDSMFTIKGLKESYSQSYTLRISDIKKILTYDELLELLK